MASINLLNDIKNVNINNSEEMLGKGAMMPFNASNSGSRKLMFGTQLEQRLQLSDPDVAYIQTGYEMEFGTYSSSYNKVESGKTVMAKIPKYHWMPDHDYYLILLDEDGVTLDIIERKSYKHITENYGYLYNTDAIDKYKVGDYISPGSALIKSKSFDGYDNRMDGKNLLTMYTACEQTTEDAIIISESAAKKMTSPLIKKVTVIINDNDIPLNIYGDSNIYKTFPDIGFETTNGVLCAIRRERKEESLFAQSYNRLREVMISDEKYTVSGRVVDIDVYCNAPDKLADNAYNSQLKYYFDNYLRMSHHLVSEVNRIKKNIEGVKMSYELQVVYNNCKDAIAGKQFYSERAFSNIVMQVTIIEEIPIMKGDKVTNRYGGKGVISAVRPDELMPRSADGEVIDIVLNMCGVYGRENAGQLFELSVSFVCMKILEFMRTNVMDVGECIEMYLDLLRIVSPSMYEYTEKYIDSICDDEKIAFIGSVTSDESIYLAIEPMTENMTIDKLNELYKTFEWIQPEYIRSPIVNSKGQIRYAWSRRPIIYGYQYIYRLKQYAEEKFSVTSLSATNIRNENTRNKASNNYKALYTRTPIRFGDMETGNLIHLGADLVVQILMLYSTSPHARRLTKEMLTGDPFSLDVKLDMDSANRNVEILNVYFKTIGLQLNFKRMKKKLIQPLTIQPMVFDRPPEALFSPLIWYDRNEVVDFAKEFEEMIEREKLIQPLTIYPLEFFK